MKTLKIDFAEFKRIGADTVIDHEITGLKKVQAVRFFSNRGGSEPASEIYDIPNYVEIDYEDRKEIIPPPAQKTS